MNGIDHKSNQTTLNSVWFNTVIITTLLLSTLPTWAQYSLEWGVTSITGGQSLGGQYTLYSGIVGGECMTIPNPADVVFTATDIGNGQVRIGYEVINGPAPRSIAFQVDLGSATITNSNDVLSVDTAFNTFIDYAKSYPQNYSLGVGHPIANIGFSGVPNFGSGITGFCINMACMDSSGNMNPGPTQTSNLITLQLHGTIPAIIWIQKDNFRKSSMTLNSQTTNLPIGVNVELP